MISFDALAGNNALKNSLKHALNERFPQTVLLSGDDPAALKALANVLAAGILCEGAGSHPCGNCLPCRKVEQGVHPDLMIVDEGEAELKVDLARQLKAENAIIPNDGERRVTVIHHAQNLNPMAQNALLKELEEPPAYAFFILTAEQPDSLLQTVRSRCTKFALEPSQAAVSDEEAASCLHPISLRLPNGARPHDAQCNGSGKTPRRALSGVLGILQAAVRDAIFVYEGSRRKSRCSLHSASRRRHSAGAVSMERSVGGLRFIDVLIDRVSRNAASAAVTCALTKRYLPHLLRFLSVSIIQEENFLTTIIGVRFKSNGKMYYFDPQVWKSHPVRV